MQVSQVGFQSGIIGVEDAERSLAGIYFERLEYGVGGLL